MLRIAVIGDRFINAELVQGRIGGVLEPTVGHCEIRAMQLEWPDDTPVDDDELQ